MTASSSLMKILKINILKYSKFNHFPSIVLPLYSKSTHNALPFDCTSLRLHFPSIVLSKDSESTHNALPVKRESPYLHFPIRENLKWFVLK